MTIREYNNKDFLGIKEIIDQSLVLDCWPHYYPQGWTEEKIKAEFDPVIKYKDSLFLVSEEREKITGLIAGHDLESFTLNEISHLTSKLPKGKIFYQRDIIIHPDYRNTTALFLFRQLKKHASSKKYTEIVTRTTPLNEKGISFFERLGFTTILTDNNPERIYFSLKL